jgi:hypothetical protein
VDNGSNTMSVPNMTQYSQGLQSRNLLSNSIDIRPVAKKIPHKKNVGYFCRKALDSHLGSGLALALVCFYAFTGCSHLRTIIKINLNLVEHEKNNR